MPDHSAAEAFERVAVNDALSVRDGVAHFEDVSLLHLAQRCGTPTYVYSRAHFASQYARLEAALQPLPHRICYAVKANGNLAILNLFASLGAGFDIVSGGELERVLRAGGDPSKVIFSGVGKSGAEIDFALKVGIGSFNVESAAELDAARTARAAPVAKSAHLGARESRHRRRHASVHLDRVEIQQVRRAARRSAGDVPACLELAVARRDRRRLPHRFADREAGAARRSAAESARTGRHARARRHPHRASRPRRRAAA